MANATVDKLKDFGLRHGEKVAMGVVALIFVGCSYLAWSHPTIDIEAEQVKKTAVAANENLTRQQDGNTIKDKLTETGVALVDFQKVVKERQAGSVDASKFGIVRPIVRLEPGAGLIRDAVELIAPTDLITRAGRGAIKVIVLDEEGNPKLKAAEKETTKGKAATKKSETLAERKKRMEDEAAAKRKAAGIAGAGAKQEAETPKDDILTAKADDYEQATRGYRFVTVIGKLDHKKMRELHAKAIKTDEADPHYVRVEMERQEQGSDGEWTEWTAVNRDAYLNVKKVLTEQDKEIVPKPAIIANLVDPLPFLQVGYYVGAHHGALVPREILQPKVDTPVAGGPGRARGKNRTTGGMPGGGGYGSAGDYGKGGMSGGMSGGANYGAGMMGEGPGGMMGEGDMPSGPAGGPSQGDFEKSKEDWLMIRAMDFDVQPDSMYRYRVRLVVANPNYGWENVTPGVDVTTKELKGPWSEITPSVNVPPDVATYALRKAPAATDPTGEKVEFQVVKWSEDDGLTVVKKFEQGPGQIIGEKRSARIPDPKVANQAKNQQYDFTSHQVLADVLGGTRPASILQNLGTNRFEAPALALVVRNDGLLVIRDQASDVSNGQMKEMADIYAEIMKEIDSPKKKGSSSLGGMYGGGMGGSMGEGMGGGGLGEQ